jgi:hypothetical protein
MQELTAAGVNMTNHCTNTVLPVEKKFHLATQINECTLRMRAAALAFQSPTHVQSVVNIEDVRLRCVVFHRTQLHNAGDGKTRHSS